MDAASFKQTFLPCHQKLYRVALRLLENAGDAEDVVQDAYLKLWNKRDELSEIRNPESYSVVLVKNLCFDFLRSNGRCEETIPEEWNRPSDMQLSKEIEIRDAWGHVRQIIDDLPPNQRQVIILRHLDDCSMENIEQITGLNAVNIRVLLSRARKKIREQFDKLNNR